MNFDKLKALVEHMTHHNTNSAQGIIDAAVELLEAKVAQVQVAAPELVDAPKKVRGKK